MTIEVRVPVLPESVSDAQLVSWQKKVGEAVSRDENLVEIETDKVVLEVPAPGDGVITQIVKEDGAMVTSDELIAVIDPSATASAPSPAAEAPAAPEPKAEAKPEPTPPPAPAKPAAAPAPATPAPAAAAPAKADVPLSPAVRRMVNEHQLDPSQIPASGKGGRLTKADVLAFVKSKPAAAAAPSSAPAAPSSA
ncbi:MAG: biotin/lipoyl-containing protein, partial [Gammaproteobacteria bacterium]